MAPIYSYGDDLNGYMWGGIGILSGDVTYQIGGQITSPQPGGSGTAPFPISKLKWPLNVTVATLGKTIPLSNDLEICSIFSKNITTYSGKMQDSDYDTMGSGALTTYSQSDADVQAITADTVLRCWLFQEKADNLSTKFGIGGGWFYEQLNWTASNVSQSDLTDPGSPPYVQNGLIGTYNVTSSMPFIELATEIEQSDSFLVLLRFGYSPFASVSDWDDHLLRQISATADLHGTAYKISLDGRYYFAPNWFLMASGDMIDFDIKGIENDYVYGNADNADGNYQGDSWTIEHETSSTQYFVSFNVGKRF